MKIAIIHHQLEHAGGMESYLFDLLTGFLSQQDEVHIYTLKIEPNLDIPKNCTVHLISMKTVFKSWQQFKFLHSCEKYINHKEYDITISLSRTQYQDILICGGTHLGFMSRKKNNFLRWLHNTLTIFYEKKALTTTSHIVAHSNSVAKELKQFYTLDHKKISLLYPPIHEKFNMSLLTKKSIYQKKFNISPKKITLLFVSMNHKLKGIKNLLETFKKIPTDQFELIICGKKPSFLLPSNAYYIGYCSNMEELYAAVDFTILLSFYEAFGLAITESLACGTPVITTQQVGAHALIQKYEGIVLENNHPDTIEQCLRNLNRTYFCVDKNFVKRNKLTITQHIDALKALIEKK